MYEGYKLFQELFSNQNGGEFFFDDLGENEKFDIKDNPKQKAMDPKQSRKRECCFIS